MTSDITMVLTLNTKALRATLARMKKLPGKVMKGLPRALPRTEETKLTYADGRIRFNTMSLKCTVLEKKPPMLLPMNASDYDVLMLHYTEDEDVIEAAGLSAKVDKLRAKLSTSIERASRAADWAGLSEELLGKWVEAHLQAEARGEEMFEMGARTVVMNEAGQVSLFTDE